jgi:hypothetical protein
MESRVQMQSFDTKVYMTVKNESLDIRLAAGINLLFTV